MSGIVESEQQPPPPSTGASLKSDLKALENERRAKVKKAKGACGSNKRKQKEVEASINAIFDRKKAELESKYKTETESPPMKDARVEEALEGVEGLAVSGSSRSGVATEEDAAAAKREKARLKKLKKKKKKQEEQCGIDDAMANAGPSNREIETNAILAENDFAGKKLSIVDVPADGHCMYRAVSHWVNLPFQEVRTLAAKVLADNEAEFSPFVDFDGGFAGYCDAVRSSAEWGGELELRALSRGLKKRIRIFNATKKNIVIGEDFEDEIMISYHRHYYDLGEHYNVVVVASVKN